MPKKSWLKGKKKVKDKSEWETEDDILEKEEDADSLDDSYDDTAPREEEEEY